MSNSVSKNLIINRKNLSDFGVIVASINTYKAPERDVEIVQVAGRNGDLTIDHGRFKNIDVEYPAFIMSDFQKNVNQLRNYLYSLKGYQRIEDDFNPLEYRMGKVAGELEVKPTKNDDAGMIKLKFNCMPQRFLKSGERAIIITTTGKILKNPTRFDSKPMIRAYGTGALTINGQTITVNSANQYTDIDCEMQNCYKGSTNCNGNVTLTTGDFFTLASGNNTVNFTGFSQVEIAPRWWQL